jgi:hypothetical protein
VKQIKVSVSVDVELQALNQPSIHHYSLIETEEYAQQATAEKYLT